MSFRFELIFNRSMTEMEAQAASAMGVDAGKLAAFDRVKEAAEFNTRLFPAGLVTLPGHAIWFKLTDWRAGAGGLVDPASDGACESPRTSASRRSSTT